MRPEPQLSRQPHRRKRTVWSAVLVFSLTLSLLPASRATTVTPPDFEQLVNESDYVVRAVVTKVTSEWRGERGQGAIVTKIELDVREVISGTPPQPLVLEMIGGKVGDEEMRIEGAPRFEVGQEDILFVQGNGRNIHPLFALMHGRYPIRREGSGGREFVCRDNRVPLEDPAEVALPMTDGATAELQRRMKDPSRALTPGEMSQRIKAAKNPYYRRKNQR